MSFPSLVSFFFQSAGLSTYFSLVSRLLGNCLSEALGRRLGYAQAHVGGKTEGSIPVSGRSNPLFESFRLFWEFWNSKRSIRIVNRAICFRGFPLVGGFVGDDGKRDSPNGHFAWPLISYFLPLQCTHTFLVFSHPKHACDQGKNNK